MSEVFTVFYCWQSDTTENHGRHLVRDALDAAADRISNDDSVPFIVSVQSDTENEPGLCNIPETILKRLREADAVVSDLTFVAATPGTPPKFCSNPNVLFELGYAFHAIGSARLICVVNEASGKTENQVFDLAHHRRPIAYTSPRDGHTRRQTVEALSEALEEALRGIIRLGVNENQADARQVLSEIYNRGEELLQKLLKAFANPSGIANPIRDAEQRNAEQAIEQWIRDTPTRLDEICTGWGALFKNIGVPSRTDGAIGLDRDHLSAGKVRRHLANLADIIRGLN